MFYLESKENVPTMINLRDSEGGTALNEIATKTAQFVDIAKLLIDNGVDVNGSDELGRLIYLSRPKTGIKIILVLRVAVN